MRQLRSCDFCDADADLGVYEVVPDSLNPTEAEQRRLVLCPVCRDRLDSVLEPFLDRLGDTDRTREVTLLDDAVSEPIADDPPARHGDDDGTAARAVGARADAGTDAGVDDGDAGESDGDDARDAAAAPDDADSDVVDAEPDDAAEAGNDGSPSPTAGPAGPSSAERGTDETPEKYRQVMRFLGNRDLPLDRAEAETLAAGAYDLDAGEAAAILDTAIERGLLVEENGQLRAKDRS